MGVRRQPLRLRQDACTGSVVLTGMTRLLHADRDGGTAEQYSFINIIN